MNRAKARYMLARAGLIGLRGTLGDLTHDTIATVSNVRREWGYHGEDMSLARFWKLLTTAAHAPLPVSKCRCVR